MDENVATDNTSVASKEAPRVQDKFRLLKPAEFQGPKRLPDESFEDYKIRRKVEGLSAKHHLRGRIIWGGGTFRTKDNPLPLGHMKPKEDQNVPERPKETAEEEAQEVPAGT